MALLTQIRTKKSDPAQTGSAAAAPWRVWVLFAILIFASINAWNRISHHHSPGCLAYRPAPGLVLVAHGAGGMPDRMYPNSISALDRSYADGLRVFEMDFHELPFGQIRTGHDMIDVLDPRGAWLSDVIAWFRRHPDARLITDMKTDNISGLTIIAREAPDLRRRIAPFMYQESEYAAVRALGFLPPVFALFANHDPDWLAFANGHAFTAVTWRHDEPGGLPPIHHPIIVHTLDSAPNIPGAWGVITNCLTPAKG